MLNRVSEPSNGLVVRLAITKTIVLQSSGTNRNIPKQNNQILKKQITSNHKSAQGM